MPLSFMEGRKAEKPPKSAAGTLGDPIVPIKAKILEALKTQRGYAQLVVEKKPLPTREGGRAITTWFYRNQDGTYGTTIRYGQLPIPLDGSNAGVTVGKVEELAPFYDEVSAAIGKGELDEALRVLHQTRSAALTSAKAA